MPPKPMKPSDETAESLLEELLTKLRTVAKPEEDPQVTLKRLLTNSADLAALLGSGEARILVVEHLGPSHTRFATGGQYAVRWVEAYTGEVQASHAIQELGPESKPTLSMAWNVAEDHLTDRIDRWLKPEAYR